MAFTFNCHAASVEAVWLTEESPSCLVSTCTLALRIISNGFGMECAGRSVVGEVAYADDATGRTYAFGTGFAGVRDQREFNLNLHPSHLSTTPPPQSAVL